jgi:hypothetical protein
VIRETDQLRSGRSSHRRGQATQCSNCASGDLHRRRSAQLEGSAAGEQRRRQPAQQSNCTSGSRAAGVLQTGALRGWRFARLSFSAADELHNW